MQANLLYWKKKLESNHQVPGDSKTGKFRGINVQLQAERNKDRLLGVGRREVDYYY